MSLQSGLYRSQDQQEADLTQGPGWTIDEQKPGFFSGLGVAPLARGIASGAADAFSVLAKGLQIPGEQSDMEAVMDGPLAASQAVARARGATAEPIPAWKQDFNIAMQETEHKTRDYAKTLMGDPRTTGTAANLVQGFSHAVTEFGIGSAAGGPLAGATVLGASEGYAHYSDLREQGVDEQTATKSGLLTAMTSGGSALLPMGMPAKWLAGLSTAGTIAAQAGAGAVINTSFGAASRYASAKILADAGYPEQAEQQKPFDETNILTDLISGAFFGAHAGVHGLRGLKDLTAANVDPSVRDAASVVQDRAEVAERAPGVPVDMPSAAVHRQALETALGDLMSGKPVDLADVNTEGATFARPDIDESAALKIIQDEFMKSGVLDDAAALDRWFTGDQEIEATTPEPKAVKPTREPAQAKAPALAGEGEEGVPAAVAPGALADRPDLKIVNDAGEALPAADEQQRALNEESQANKEAEPMMEAAVNCEARHA